MGKNPQQRVPPEFASPAEFDMAWQVIVDSENSIRNRLQFEWRWWVERLRSTDHLLFAERALLAATLEGHFDRKQGGDNRSSADRDIRRHNQMIYAEAVADEVNRLRRSGLKRGLKKQALTNVLASMEQEFAAGDPGAPDVRYWGTNDDGRRKTLEMLIRVQRSKRTKRPTPSSRKNQPKVGVSETT